MSVLLILNEYIYFIYYYSFGFVIIDDTDEPTEDVVFDDETNESITVITVSINNTIINRSNTGFLFGLTVCVGDTSDSSGFVGIAKSLS